MLEAGVSAFELGECLHVRFVSFRFALKGFAWRQTAARCFTVSQSPKTLSCARVWLKKKTECYALCFSQNPFKLRLRESGGQDHPAPSKHSHSTKLSPDDDCENRFRTTVSGTEIFGEFQDQT